MWRLKDQDAGFVYHGNVFVGEVKEVKEVKEKQFSLIFFLPPIRITDVNFSYYGNQKLFYGGNKAKIRLLFDTTPLGTAPRWDFKLE